MAAKLEKIIVNGLAFWVEVGELEVVAAPGAKTNTAAKGVALAQSITPTDLQNLVDALVAPARAALAKVGDIKECAVELSLGLKGEVGFFLAKGEANAALKISVKW